MHVLFVEPAFPSNQRKFVHGLAAVGARVTAIGEAPAAALGDLGRLLDGYEQVSSVVKVIGILPQVASGAHSATFATLSMLR